MIASLTGRLVSVSLEETVIDVGGVGYQLFVAKGNLGALMGQQGQIVTLYVETHVREDHIHLFGFLTAEEKYWFRKLLAVSGVGAKSALSILSACPPARLIGAIAAQDHKAIQAAEGVGPKLAQRIVIDLKDKLPQTGLAPASVVSIVKGKADVAETSVVEDCVLALVGLGYDRTLAYQTASRIAYANDNKIALNDLIKAALQELAS